jgi:hypothetical protein
VGTCAQLWARKFRPEVRGAPDRWAPPVIGGKGEGGYRFGFVKLGHGPLRGWAASVQFPFSFFFLLSLFFSIFLNPL